MKKILELKWQILAAALLLGGLFLSRGGAAALLPLGRILLPVIAVVIGFNLVKKRLVGKFGDLMRKQMEAAGFGAGMPGQAPAGGGKRQAAGKQVIDLCPKCGSYLAPGHRCKK